ncbi:MAG: hypothetical protein IJH75_04065 [Mogibacterium sp.]|nr:hypothetical protein [Mogibacterium sp.]
MYNFMLAFFIACLVYVIGEWVTTATKAWIPSVFVTAILVMVGFWTIIPKTLYEDTGFLAMAGSTGMFLLITHMGTIISIKQLIEQWKTVVVCLAGLVGMVAFGMLIATIFVDRELVIAGLPPLTGGVVATSLMSQAATEKGLELAAGFASIIYCVQGFIGYPLTAICLHKYGDNLLKEWRSGELSFTEEELAQMRSVGMFAISDDSNVKKLLPKIPDKWNSNVVMLMKLSFVAWIAFLLGQHTPLSGAVWALLLGVITCHIGFLETNILTRANSYGLMIFTLTFVIFTSLQNVTPATFTTMIGPMIALIVIGVIGMAIFAFIIAKVLKMSFYIAFANGLTALYGFPFDAIITESTCNSMTPDADERSYLMSKMFPSMITGGFVTVTITSVILAGIFINML